MVRRDLALTVLELEPNEFHWVLMEAVQAESDESLVYRPIDSSTQGLPDYSEALIHGASALRVMQGLAPFGQPAVADAARPQPVSNTTTSANADAAPAASHNATTVSGPAFLDSELDPDSCMFTTGQDSIQ
ncbi:MAG: hypothetical protein KKC85_11880 [Gammaproteobacteria bacterium]|nr:hypothetical protein [Gammaproteobacteria bacterium]MBU2287125.1 hypothetical protein [Gammaproteobacteria bacterium]